jgi:tetratricopeptide (TPR) repeat protein
VEKIGEGDRAFLARDYQTALFAYLDAAYMATRSPVPRVRVARAYLALRHPDRAIAQAELALAMDPESADARRVLGEARGATARTAPPASPASGASPLARSAAPQVAPAKSGPAPSASSSGQPAAAQSAIAQPRVFRFVPDPDPRPATGERQAAAPPAAAGPPAQAVAVPVASGAAGATPVPAATAGAAPAAERAAAPAPAPSAAERYRTALAHLSQREFERADAALGEAIAIDPRLAVAHAARGSARFGLGRYREAAEDYRAALALDPALATPLYGLAECHRVLGDARGAAELYERYAQSRSPDVREDLRAISAKRAQELK